MGSTFPGSIRRILTAPSSHNAGRKEPPLGKSLQNRRRTAHRAVGYTTIGNASKPRPEARTVRRECAPMPNYGVIDLGSNSIRLVIYNVKGGRLEALFSKKDFRSVINEKKIAGLSAYVVDGVFTEAGVRKAADVLGEHLRRRAQLRLRGHPRLRDGEAAQLQELASRDGRRERSRRLPRRDHLGARRGAPRFVGATCDREIESGIADRHRRRVVRAHRRRRPGRCAQRQPRPGQRLVLRRVRRDDPSDCRGDARHRGGFQDAPFTRSTTSGPTDPPSSTASAAAWRRGEALRRGVRGRRAPQASRAAPARRRDVPARTQPEQRSPIER